MGCQLSKDEINSGRLSSLTTENQESAIRIEELGALFLDLLERVAALELAVNGLTERLTPNY